MYYVYQVNEVYLGGLTERNFNKCLPNMPATRSSSRESSNVYKQLDTFIQVHTIQTSETH